MIIAHVFWSLSYGGIETMLTNIANYQVDKGHDVNIIIIDDHYNHQLVSLLDKRIKLHILGRAENSKSPIIIWKFNRIIHKINPDVLHLHSSALFCIVYGKRFTKRCISTLHDMPKGKISVDGALSFLKRFKIVNFLFRDGNITSIDKLPRVFAISDAVHSALLNKHNIPSKVIKNGILTANFLHKQEYVPHTPLRIVQISRLEYLKKGQDLMIRAAAYFKGRIQVDFIGDGPSRQYLQALTTETGADNFVNFLGSRTQNYLCEHLHEYDLLVQPSRIEGFGLTVAEAMAAGVPVLVSNGDGPAEITEGDKYGWAFIKGDLDDFIAKLTYILDHYDQAASKAEQATLKVKECYDVSSTAQSYLDNYAQKNNELLS